MPWIKRSNLIAAMVGSAIALLLASRCGVRRLPPDPEDVTEFRVNLMEGSCRPFWIENSRLPRDFADLRSDEDFSESIGRDGWGHALRLRIVDLGARRMEIRSAGDNGERNDSDDIVREFTVGETEKPK